MNRAVFLDRDGVINQAILIDGKPTSPMTLKELIIRDDAFDALTRLKRAHYLLIVVTNQPDVARQKISKQLIEQFHTHLRSKLPIDQIFVCYHDDSDHCDCRKPKPGLLLQAVKPYHIDLSASFMIGDRWRDVQAGKKAGCQTIFLDRGYAESKNHDIPADFTTPSLSEAVNIILEHEHGWFSGKS